PRGHGLRALTLLTITGLVLVTARGLLTGNWWFFVMLIWNLTLAWFPLGVVMILLDLRRARLASRWVMAGALAMWLAFLPNAPYIITDLFHIQHINESLLWFDTLTIFIFAMTGLLLGLYSTALVHRLIDPLAGRPLAWALMLGCQMLSGFGIYLGRFGRWNSWQVMTHPFRLLRAITQAIQEPLALKLTLTYGFGLACLYVAFFVYVNGFKIARATV
ncbi:MAG: DUF1361 domain-containing protein, partial [Bacteroidetes bacterium]|nr:DUF1361 domain-containing protein [Fibrella sp.]